MFSLQRLVLWNFLLGAFVKMFFWFTGSQTYRSWRRALCRAIRCPKPVHLPRGNVLRLDQDRRGSIEKLLDHEQHCWPELRCHDPFRSQHTRLPPEPFKACPAHRSTCWPNSERRRSTIGTEPGDQSPTRICPHSTAQGGPSDCFTHHTEQDQRLFPLVCELRVVHPPVHAVPDCPQRESPPCVRSKPTARPSSRLCRLQELPRRSQNQCNL